MDLGSGRLSAPEVEAGIDAECTERVGHRKARFAIVVGMKHQRSTDKVFAVVVHNACTGYQIEIDVLYPAFGLEIVVVYPRFLVSDARKQG